MNMKKFLLSVVCLMVVSILSVMAQNTLVATLSHNGVTTQFYGSSALQSAHDTAEDGDIITLSTGFFDAPTISKAVKIVGAGMGHQGENINDSTVINGKILIDSIVNTKYKLIFEGLRLYNQFNSRYAITNTEFHKCKLDYWGPFGGAMGSGSNITFIGCRIMGFTCSTENVTINFISCMVNNAYPEYSSSMFHFENSVVCMPHNRWEWTTAGMKYSTFNNCVLFVANADYNKSLPETATVTNSVALHGDILLNISDTSNVTVNFDNFFKTFQGGNELKDNVEYDLFELSDAAKAVYKGDDGKEVGIYGGMHPYSSTLSIPQFTKANVAKKAVNGKLSVNIELNGGN